MSVFQEKLKTAMTGARLDSAGLSARSGLSLRTILAYESGASFPRERSLRRLSDALGVSMRYLKDDFCADPSAGAFEETFLKNAYDSYGVRGMRELSCIFESNSSLFAGGTLREDQQQAFYEALSEAYFLNKKHAREKFGRRH